MKTLIISNKMFDLVMGLIFYWHKNIITMRKDTQDGESVGEKLVKDP